jgi:aldehyde dehydrogenase (NAD+)
LKLPAREGIKGHMTAPAPLEVHSDETIAQARALFEGLRANRWQMARTTVEARLQRLDRLREVLVAHRERLAQAAFRDFRKPPTEFDLTEMQPVLLELAHVRAHLADWLRPRAVPTPLTLAGTRAEVRLEPKGVALVLGAWNYPFHLTAAPVIPAVAAGNCVLVRPSEKAPHSAEALRLALGAAFDPREVACVTGGIALADALLDLPFDHIFFTGSPKVGKKVMARAAEHLASVTLELGGKSPAIVDETADVALAGERIAWGKFVNGGQTCVAPDYVLVHESKHGPLVEALRAAVMRLYGGTEEARRESPDLARMIDGPALLRVKDLLDRTVAQGARVELGGGVDVDERYFAPTVLTGVAPDSPIMQEEIFGPVLPVLTYRTADEAVALANRHGKPLALYLFSRRDRNVQELLSRTTAGGTVVNNVLVHLANSELPFGGVGGSGQGSYHGLAGIRAFSHERSILHQGRPNTLKLLFPPYTAGKRRLLRWMERLFT